MGRNSSGSYSLPDGSVVNGQTITATLWNDQLNDVASALTQSMASTGVTTATGPMKLTDGSVAAPGLTFGADIITGFWRNGTGQIGLAVSGTQSALFNSDKSVTWAGSHTIAGTISANIGTIPAGVCTSYAGTSAPAGWLLCFGQAISRTTFALLFTAIGTTFGAGDGSTTFNVPDGRGYVFAGKDNMGGSAANRIGTVGTDNGTIVGSTLGSTGGSSTHAQTIGEGYVHHHAALVLNSGHAHGFTAGFASGQCANAGGIGQCANSSSTTNSATENTQFADGLGNNNQTQNSGTGNAMAWMQPTIIMNKIIFAGV